MAGKRKEQKKTPSPSGTKKREPEKAGASTDPLIVNLGSRDDLIRVKTRQSLVSMGKAALPLLIEALKNKHYLVRWEAAKALGEIGDPQAAPALVEALEDEEFDVRWLAAEGLIKLNINGLKPLLQALEKRGDSEPLREGAHHVFHDLAKGALKKTLTPVVAALEGIEPGEEIPWAATHETGIEVPRAALQALEMLEKIKKL
jgi:HEAT repeat protein